MRSVLVTLITLSAICSSAAPIECWRQIKDAPVGSECITGSGVTFVRVKSQETGHLGWRDMGIGGKTWYDDTTTGTQASAQKHCDSIQGQTLPSYDDYLVALNHSYAAIVRKGDYGHFWTSNNDYPQGAMYLKDDMRSFAYCSSSLEMKFKCVSDSDPTPTIQPCVTIKHDAPTGTECMTSKGVKFKKVKVASSKAARGWKDQGANGKLWYIGIADPLSSVHNALDFCENNFDAAILPEKADFELAMAHGFDEFLREFYAAWDSYWTRTQVSSDPYSKYYYYDSEINRFRTNPYEVGGFVRGICVAP